MEYSSPRLKALAVALGASFWFLVFTSAINMFSIEKFLIFVTIVGIINQIFSKKISRGLDAFASINTKIFLGALFIIVISLYGIFFKILRIDLLRIKTQSQTYWLEIEQLKPEHIYRQY
jgi:hypothetical protein